MKKLITTKVDVSVMVSVI